MFAEMFIANIYSGNGVCYCSACGHKFQRNHFEKWIRAGSHCWTWPFQSSILMPFDCGSKAPDLGPVNRSYLFLGAGGLVARVSSWAVWWCWALWMGLRVSHHRDTTPGLLVPSVIPAAQPSEQCMLEGYRFENVRRFCVCVWVWECGSTKDRARQPLIYSPEPWNMLQSAPARVGNLPLGTWHGKNSPKIKA